LGRQAWKTTKVEKRGWRRVSVGKAYFEGASRRRT
jgi:hypothetical protein